MALVEIDLHRLSDIANRHRKIRAAYALLEDLMAEQDKELMELATIPRKKVDNEKTG